jgi:purine-nucleoside phosphorylase
VITAAHLYEEARRCAGVIREAHGPTPTIGLILGTGLGGLAREIETQTEIPYSDLPDFPLSTVESHTGRLLLGRLSGHDVVAMQGRFHLYEGYDASQVTFGVRVMKLLGATTLLVSNVSGGLDPAFARGDLMILNDHINLMGSNPLIGPNDERFGPRFPDMSEPYSQRLLKLANQVALENSIPVRNGIYVSLAGPSLETRAEYRMLRAMGADSVGMSTVPEVIVARHMGMEIFAASVITDMCLPDALAPTSVSEIIATAQRAEPKLTRMFKLLVERLPRSRPGKRGSKK